MDNETIQHCSLNYNINLPENKGSFNQSIDMEFLIKLEKIIFNLNEKNIDSSVKETVELFDYNFPHTFNYVICNLIYNAFISQRNSSDLYFKYLKRVQTKEFEINKNSPDIIKNFGIYISKIKSQESFYLLEKMIEENLIITKITRNIDTNYFAHYKNVKENKQNDHRDPIEDQFFDNYEELSKNDWELHKQLIKEGVNPNEIAKIIRNDEIEKLQEISSQTDFDFNQTIEPSLYERCSFINKENVSLIDYAAFFSSIKCFKYLLMNGSNVKNTGKYAVAGGNEEIIHLCEQNHSSFEGAYEAAIMFHRNKIFNYIYEKKLDDIQRDLPKFSDNIHLPIDVLNKKYLNIKMTTICNEYRYICIQSGSFETLLFLEKNLMKIDDFIINESAFNGNLYLVKYFLQNNKLPKDILISSSCSQNIELINYILEQKGIDINVKDDYGYTALIRASNNGYIKIVKLLLEHEGIDVNAKDDYGNTALIRASDKGHTEIVKLLLEQEGIDVNAKGNYGNTALIYASLNGHTEIVKLLLEQEGIDVNAKGNYGKTALIYASLNGHTEIVKLLLEQEGINVNAKDNYGNTALINASENGHTEIVKLLLEQEGINVNAKDNYGNTALIYASLNGHTEIVKFLLQQKGIDVNAKDKYGRTALMKIFSKSNAKIVEMFLELEEVV